MRVYVLVVIKRLRLASLPPKFRTWPGANAGAKVSYVLQFRRRAAGCRDRGQFQGAPHLAGGARQGRDRADAGGVLLPLARYLREGRRHARPVRPGVQQGLQGPADRLWPEPGRYPGRLAQGRRREVPHPRGDGEDQVTGRLGRDHGDAQEAARGAAEAPPGRQQVDRHRRHQPVRQFGLQPRRRADRRREQAQARAQGVGKARVPEPRQHQGTGHPQHQDGAAPPAQVRPRRRSGRARHSRHDRRHRAAGLARYQDAPGAAQRGQAAAVPRCGRIDGPVHQAGGRAVQRRHRRVQEPRILLLPQLPLRRRVEG